MNVSTERPQHLANSSCAGRGIVRCFVALHLLFLELDPLGERFLCQSPSNSRLSQSVEHFAKRLIRKLAMLTGLELLVLCTLLFYLRYPPPNRFSLHLPP